jgi:hypothetical protein
LTAKPGENGIKPQLQTPDKFAVHGDIKLQPIYWKNTLSRKIYETNLDLWDKGL